MRDHTENEQSLRDHGLSYNEILLSSLHLTRLFNVLSCSISVYIKILFVTVIYVTSVILESCVRRVSGTMIRYAGYFIYILDIDIYNFCF